MIGPHVRRLWAHKMSVGAIPKGGGIADGIRFLSDPAALGKSAREATQWVAAAIQAVREAGDPNPWREADDEAIAAEILRLAKEKRA